MKIIKRNGAEAAFDISNIESAITRANAAVAEQFQMTTTQIHRIAESVALSCQEMGRSQRPGGQSRQDGGHGGAVHLPGHHGADLRIPGQRRL